jgi:hypothetical protein
MPATRIVARVADHARDPDGVASNAGAGHARDLMLNCGSIPPPPPAAPRARGAA